MPGGLCDPGDVATRLARPLTAAETAAVSGLIEEATALVEGYLGRGWVDAFDVPTAVKVVTSRVVARALTGGSRFPPGASQVGSAMGPLTHTTTFAADVETGQQVWLGKADKIALSPYLRRGVVTNVPMFRRCDE